MKKTKRNVQGLNGYNVFVQEEFTRSVSQKLSVMSKDVNFYVHFV